MRIMLTVASTLLMSVSMLAQTAPAAPKAKDAPLKPPVITSVEEHAIQNIDKMTAPLLEQLNPLLAQREEVIREILANNPGYKWTKDPTKNYEGLVAATEPNKSAPTVENLPPPAKK